MTTTDKRCVTSIMYGKYINKEKKSHIFLTDWRRDKPCFTNFLDLNNCRGHNPCFHGGICFNLYGRWTCKCPHGFKPRDCLQRKIGNLVVIDLSSDLINSSQHGFLYTRIKHCVFKPHRPDKTLCPSKVFFPIGLNKVTVLMKKV